MLEADEADSESDSDSDSGSHDDENEVERTLGDDYIDAAEDGKRARPNGRAKRKRDANGLTDGADWEEEGVTRISFDI